MRPEEISKIRRDLEPPWNDLREQRVLGRIQEARRRRPAPIAAGAAVFAAVAAIAIAIAFVVARRAVSPPAAAREQRMALADGSEAFLVREAQVQVEEQRADRVHIAQRSGEVRYEVRPDRSREFVVFAAGATVRVRGTIFTVDVESDHVEVRVERGKVEVDDGARTRELVVGESLRVPARAGAEAPASEAPADVPPGEPSREGAVSDDAGAARDEARPPPRSGPAEPTFAELTSRADAARAAGRQDDAAKALEKLLALYPQDPRAPNALFTLGKVERARRDPAASARAFEQCLRAAPGGPLAQDALAEAANSWAAAGAGDAARAEAQRYLDRWPSGTQATQMRAILRR